MNRLILFASCLALLTACGSNSNPDHHETTEAAAYSPTVARISVPKDTMIDLTLASDAGQSYYIYVPSSVSNIDSASAIVFFDPHGAGSLPVEKYKKLAGKFGVILAGSNNSKNGIDASQTEQFANNIVADLSSRIGIKSNNICLAGFSGGAKVALQSGANNQNIGNIIYAGASTQINPNHNIKLLGFAGQQDMNYTDLLTFAQSMQDKGSLVEFGGKHEWPDTTTFRKAFYWLAFDKAKSHSSPADPAVIDAFQKETDQNARILQNKNAQTEEYQEYANAATWLNGLADVSEYKSKADAIAVSDGYKKALATKNETIRKEAGEKQILMAAFQKEDGQWWTKTINHYKTSPLPSDKRVLGFISLACYSYSSQLIAHHDLKNAEFILSIYELTDPDNTDQLYFHAELYAMQNEPDLAVQYLSKAVDKGFTDWQQIEAEPAFTPLRGYESFSRLLTSLKNSPKQGPSPR